MLTAKSRASSWRERRDRPCAYRRAAAGSTGAGEIGSFEWYPGTGKLVVSDACRRVWGLAPVVEVTADLLVSRIGPSHLHLVGPIRITSDTNPLRYVEYLITRADNSEQR